MIDIKLIREQPALVKENIKKKFQEHKLVLVDDVLTFDAKIKALKSKAEALRHKRNKLSEEINTLKKEGKDIVAQLQEVKDIPNQIKIIEDEQAGFEEKILACMMSIPNMIHESVPIGKDENENVEVEKIGKPKTYDFPLKNHIEVAEGLGVVDFETSAVVSGNGFYYLKGELALLNQALLRFAIEQMVKKGYEYIETPLMIHADVVKGVMSFTEMNAMMYKMEEEDLFLIGTSEHSLIGYYKNKIVDIKKPIRNTSYSMCFRKEVGSHGINEKGLYRTHQFNKVEMVVICRPEESYTLYAEMLEICKDIYRQLEIPTRVLECCSGDLADLKAKSCDLEFWSPVQGKYAEVGSLTNMEEAQARRLNIKFIDVDGQKKFVHTLNNTAIATSRGMLAILENNQNADGSVTIPKVLRPYMFGKEKIEKQ